MFIRLLLGFSLICFWGITPVSLLGQDTPPDEKTEEKSDAANSDKKGKSKEKKYSDIITEKAVTDEGLFTVHKVDQKYYFEIPLSLLEREILVVSRISGYVKNLSFGGAGMSSRPEQVIRWQLFDGKMLLRSVSYNSVATEELPIYQSVRNNNFEPIIMTFDVAVYNEDSTAVVIDPGSLFTTDVAMIGPMSEEQRKNFGISALDSKRSLISGMKSFPENVEVRHILTYKGSKLPDNAVTGTLSVEMNQSFVLLPEKPMVPRYYDNRVGYFSIQQTDYGLDEQKAAKRRYITRWRLEPKDPAAYARGELVEPIKPIVYYVDPATPEQWRPYLKKGIEDWQKAFEAAGFKNAILAKDPPSPEEDPDWSPEDVRYSVVRYISTDIQNAVGPHVHDPRSGEIIESDILWYHNVMNLLRNWYFIQTAAYNPLAQKPKFEEAVMGELVRFVAAHEVGHTLGLPHNMGASSAYPVDSLRSRTFTRKMGTAPSIMDYARFNYIAQPDDNVDPMPQIGPYDLWAIEYGYRYYPNVQSPDDEKDILLRAVKEKAANRLYHYGPQRGNPFDPTAQTEDLGDDSMLASEYGLANLKRITRNLVNWTALPGEPYEELGELYGQVINQYNRYIGHVITNVGGVYEQQKTGDEAGVIYTYVPKDKQKRAVEFLNKHVFETPQWLIDSEIIQRIQPSGAFDRISSVQIRALERLFASDRLGRLAEAVALQSDNPYTPRDLFDQTRNSLITRKDIDPYRRALQRAYVDLMVKLALEENKSGDADLQSLAWRNLKSIKKALGHVSGADPLSRAHAKRLKREIRKVLKNK